MPEATITPDEQYEQALVALVAAENNLDNAVRRLIAQKVRKLYPTAATLITLGSDSEDGLMHANVEAILDADGTTLAISAAGVSDSEEWDELTDTVNPLLHEISERDPDTYRQETEIDLTGWAD